jgi:reactive intermediate/imine deaminase
MSMNKNVIHTHQAPQAVGTYSQAVRAGDMVFLSGQLGIEPANGTLLEGFEEQTHQVFRNLRAVCQAAGGDLGDIVRLGVFLTDMSNFARFNQIMGEYFTEPYPARAAVQVVGLPKGGVVEAEATMVCSST